MDLARRSRLVYALLAGIWLLVVGWQVNEHVRVREAAKTELRNRSREIAITLSSTIRAMRFGRRTLLQERIEPVINELVHGRTNAIVKSTDLISIVLLNAAGEAVASAGVSLDPKDIPAKRELWTDRIAAFVHPVTFGNQFEPNMRPEDSTNPIVVVPLRQQPAPASDADSDQRGRRRSPPWGVNWMEENEALAEQRELHGLVLGMSTGSYRSLVTRDLWQRCILAFFAGLSAVGIALVWRTQSRTAELQIRLIRASEMNSHLREMNLAAAGLAHETRNPLNIIRGMAQMISKQSETPDEIRDKSRAIVDQTDRVTAQLNEFINYSRPRELRRSVVPLMSAVHEIVRALAYDTEEKNVRVEVKGDALSIEADEQLLRQTLFNLVLNAVQAVEDGGEIAIVILKVGGDAALEIRDNGPGVPPDRRQEIFKPYFTTQQKGTGLGLAVVQQIVLAHGWEIQCLGNQPKGAIFRLTHLKIAT
jgi:signal transduction histidine kinase